MKIGTIITIGALAFLILVVVVIVVIFFWQRHSLPLDVSSNPVSPKISRSSTNQLIADVAKGLASHFDGPEPNNDCYSSFRPSANLTVPTDYCGRSAGDGGSEEGNYSSLNPTTRELDDSHYAMVRQPDGRADEPCYSSLRLVAPYRPNRSILELCTVLVLSNFAVRGQNFHTVRKVTEATRVCSTGSRSMRVFLRVS